VHVATPNTGVNSVGTTVTIVHWGWNGDCPLLHVWSIAQSERHVLPL
jgi:hypothetical protein